MPRRVAALWGILVGLLVLMLILILLVVGLGVVVVVYWEREER